MSDPAPSRGLALPLLAAVLGSAALVPVALALERLYPSFSSIACSPPASGCLEWGLITIGPFWALGYLLCLMVLFAMVLLPPILVLARRSRATSASAAVLEEGCNA